MTTSTITRPDKAFQDLRARGALAGAVVHRTEDDRGEPLFIVTRHALTLQLHDLESVELRHRGAFAADLWKRVVAE